MSNFELMEPVVEAMCKSMEEEPDKWKYGTHTVWHVSEFSSTELWLSSQSPCITHKWNGRSREVIFSEAQGRRLGNSFNKLKGVKASESQQKLLNSLKEAPLKEEITDYTEIIEAAEKQSPPESSKGGLFVAVALLLLFGLVLNGGF